jgi:outer membrane receptor protein involved in Fe transport
LTINYGARLDLVDAFTHASQLSPRVNVVWQPTDRTTLHAGYARYFAPPALEAVAQADIFAFRNTTATPTVFQNDPVQPERSNYFDAGITQKLLPGWQVGLDAFYKNATNEGDVGQFGAPIILTAFSYAEAKIYGGEVSTSYRRGPWSIYGNAGWSKSQATGISSAQFNFAPDELAYINSHWIYVDHDQRWTASGGIAYTLNRDSNHSTLLSTDFLYSSGLRATVVTPNDIALPSYAVVNMSAVQKLPLGLGSGTELQFDILNLFDKVYQIRNGTGVSVGASQYGLRRTFLAGLTQRF